jgi:predicted DNA-binding transcriptional regulator YafY
VSDYIPHAFTDSGLRMARIEHLLRTRGQMKAAELMADLQCSRATLKRDVRYMRETLGASIGGDNDGYRLVGEWSGVAATLAEQLQREGAAHA